MCQQEKIFKNHVRSADNSNVSVEYRLHDYIMQIHEGILFHTEAASTFMSLLSVSRVSLHIESAIVSFWANDL